MSNTARLVLIAVLYLVFWHGAIRSHWSEDDYLNVSAVIDRIHAPGDLLRSWAWVDAVDGNHRPLATYVWLGGIRLVAARGNISPEFLSRILQAAVWILLLWCLFQAATLLGAEPVAAWIAVLFLVSRSSLFTLHHWTAAMSDVFSMLFCLVAFGCWLRSRDPSGAARRLWHVGALAAFFLALSAKQSALVFPGIVFAATLIERSGWRSALREAVPFALLGIAEFALARSLFAGRLPYPVALEPYHLLMTPAYVWWTLSGVWPLRFDVPGLLGSAFFGWMVLVGLAVLVLSRRFPDIDAPQSALIRLGLAGFVLQTAQMALLPFRFLPYYTGSGAVWLSFAVGAAGHALWLAARRNPRRRLAFFAVVGLIAALSLGEIHLKATGAVFSGSYPSAASYQRFPRLAETFRPHLHDGVRTLVLVDFPYLKAWYAGLVRWYFPEVTRILFVGKPDSGPRAGTLVPQPPPDSRHVFHNGLGGAFESASGRVTDGQPWPFQWDSPLPASEAGAILAREADAICILQYRSDTDFVRLSTQTPLLSLSGR